jgi:tyrosine phenol-lyase
MAKHEPHKIKSIRNLTYFSLPDRLRYLRNVDYNVGLLPASLVTFDMVSQGSSAMSQEQVGALFLGDEAYAGARNFVTLNRRIQEIFGLEFVCPLHNLYGGLKLLSSIKVREGVFVGGNSPAPKGVVEYFGGAYEMLAQDETGESPGKIDLEEARRFLADHSGRVAFFYVDLFSGGCLPIDLENLAALREAADETGTLLVIDMSCIAQYATYLIKTEASFQDQKVAEVLTRVSALAHTVVFDAGQDALSNVGGFLATNDAGEFEKYQNEVVVFEGLHTYGGMAGRTMEVVAVGLGEMIDDLQADWIAHQADMLAAVLDDAGIPFHRGGCGVYLQADRILPQAEGYGAAVLAAALYLAAGIRAHIEGPYRKHALLPVLIPRRALMNTQLREIAEALIEVVKRAGDILPLTLLNEPDYFYEARYGWIVPHLEDFPFASEPHVIHSIEHVGMKTREERQAAMAEAGYNTFLLMSEDVSIDLLTDSGTSALSVEQWGRYLAARETPAASDAYYEILESSWETYGYKHIIMTHQGRAAEHIMSQLFIEKGDYVPGNMYFTTTKLHQEMAGGVFVDVIVDQAHQTASDYPWKGNIDLGKLEAVYDKAVLEGKKIAYISYEFDVNMAGGQPVSMDNIREVYAFCQPRGIPVFFDATRCAENARFIQARDPNYEDTPVADILLEMFSYGDGATISSKKDMLTNLSGSLVFKDNEEWYRRGLQMLQLFEGPSTSGGTSAGDMAAHAQGLREMVDDAYINSRVEQTEYLGALLKDAGVPIVLPPGGHAIFLDARAFLSHLDQDLFPAQMLASQIFIETGVRSMERGNVSKGRDPDTGGNYRPALELVRLTIPRRVYTKDHMKAVAEGIVELYSKRETIKGLAFTYEPQKLRFFQSRFEPVSD